MNLRTRILNELALANKPLRKDNLANTLDVSVHSLAHPLAELNNAFLVHQSKGFYRITPDGKAAIEQDPTLSNFFTARTYARITLKFEGKEFDNTVCQAILSDFKKRLNTRELKEWASRVLLPFVMMYLIAQDKEIPVGKTGVQEPTPVEEQLMNAINTFFEVLR